MRLVASSPDRCPGHKWIPGHPWRQWKRWLQGLTIVICCQFTLFPACAAELSDIRERGYLRIGVKENLRPLGFRGEDGQLEGLEIELGRWLATALLGSPEAVEFQPVANRDRLSAVMEDDVDLVIAQLGATAGRARLINFSTPYYLDGTAVIVPADLPFAEITDLRGRSVAVLNGSSTIATLRSRVPALRLVGVDSYAAALILLEQGEVAAFAGDATVLTGWVQEYPQYVLLPELLSVEPLAVAIPKGLEYDSLRRSVDAAIEAWYKQGELQEQVQRWGLPAAGIPSFDGLP